MRLWALVLFLISIVLIAVYYGLEHNALEKGYKLKPCLEFEVFKGDIREERYLGLFPWKKRFYRSDEGVLEIVLEPSSINCVTPFNVSMIVNREVEVEARIERKWPGADESCGLYIFKCRGEGVIVEVYSNYYGGYSAWIYAVNGDCDSKAEIEEFCVLSVLNRLTLRFSSPKPFIVEQQEPGSP